MKNYQLGLLLGACAGLIDLIPMFYQKLPFTADLSAFSLWIISGFLISTSNLKIKGIYKGMLISILVLTPTTFLVGGKQLIPIFIMTLILGSILGYSITSIQTKA